MPTVSAALTYGRPRVFWTILLIVLAASNHLIQRKISPHALDIIDHMEVVDQELRDRARGVKYSTVVPDVLLIILPYVSAEKHLHLHAIIVGGHVIMTHMAIERTTTVLQKVHPISFMVLAPMPTVSASLTYGRPRVFWTLVLSVMGVSNYFIRRKISRHTLDRLDQMHEDNEEVDQDQRDRARGIQNSTILPDLLLTGLPWVSAEDYLPVHALIVAVHIICTYMAIKSATRILEEVHPISFMTESLTSIRNHYFTLSIYMCVLGVAKELIHNQLISSPWGGPLIQIVHVLFVEKETLVASSEFIFTIIAYSLIN